MHEPWMEEALALAELGRYTVSPNPMVGAVVVKNGKKIGEGFHQRAGGAHAEIDALSDAGDQARGADLYVNLEPCCHTGRTGPCTGAIIEAGISRVIIATEDPNPRVGGQGVSLLRDAGIEVIDGVLAEPATWLNRAFIKWVTTGVPWVTLKLAMSLDGRVASATGDSQWITGEPMRAHVHRMRAASDAIMVGAGTVRTDDPRLTVRDTPPLFAGGEYDGPLKVVVDSKLGLSVNSRVFEDGHTLIVTTQAAKRAWFGAYQEKGAEIEAQDHNNGRIAMQELFASLGSRGAGPITSVLVEGGAILATDLVRRGLVDECRFHLAPKLMGGDGLAAISSLGVLSPAEGPSLNIIDVRPFGKDIEVITTFA